MSFAGFNGGRGGNRGGGRYGGRGGGVGGGFGGEGGGAFGSVGHNPCSVCGNRHHPAQTCWPICFFCGQRHHAGSVCEPKRRQQQQQTGYAGGHQAAPMDIVLGLAQQLQADNEQLRATVDALQTQVNALQTRVNAALASPLAPRASTQYGPTLAARQGVQTAGGSTGQKRAREEDAGADATGGLEATGQLAPSKKRRQRAPGRKRSERLAVEGAESIKGEGEGEGKDEDENETMADNVSGPIRPLKAKPLLFSAPLTRSIPDTPLPLAFLPFAPRRLAPIAPAASGTTVPSQQQASVRRFSGFEFTMDALVRAATPAEGLDGARATIVQQAANYLVNLNPFEQRGYARRAENNGLDPVTQFMNESESAESE